MTNNPHTAVSKISFHNQLSNALDLSFIKSMNNQLLIIIVNTYNCQVKQWLQLRLMMMSNCFKQF